ncbi:MAG: Gfo/Idh/MocA family oxidoreductase [Eubacteriales bacterium]|nr:Gfo/Idh/MocA family oxidoreductase [Eubacteriales bacterium]
MKLAILGAGGIAFQMAKTVAGMEEVQAYGVAARDLERAQAFAREYAFEKAYGSYEEMLADPLVDLVYVATPHSHHYKHAKMCLEAGKHVLCEKSFTVNADQARALCAMAKEKGLLITEAIWTRYMPSRKMIQDILESGVIGEVSSLTANLGYTLFHSKRIWDPCLAGGALLDVGVYPINFARMIFGDTLKDVQAHAIFKDGVDVTDSMVLTFQGNKVATLQSSVCGTSDRMGSIFGTKGYVQVQNINNPEKITVFDNDHQEIASYLPPQQITGYEYEVEACLRALKAGELECPEMPHQETIRVMEIMDGIRKAWGYEIPLVE